jgi:hypothetical protein
MTHRSITPAGKWTQEAFEEHHRQHPEIYARFCHYAKQAAARRDHYSAKSVFHRVRWDTEIGESGDFKIDDGWISHYARKFMADYPEHEGFFETRVRLVSYHAAANSAPIPSYGPQQEIFA